MMSQRPGADNCTWRFVVWKLKTACYIILSHSSVHHCGICPSGSILWAWVYSQCARPCVCMAIDCEDQSMGVRPLNDTTLLVLHLRLCSGDGCWGLGRGKAWSCLLYVSSWGMVTGSLLSKLPFSIFPPKGVTMETTETDRVPNTDPVNPWKWHTQPLNI